MAHPQPYDPYYLLQQPPLPLPQPQPEEYNKDRSGINTLFVSGLPDDVKAREIHNLFRRRGGFDSCQLKYTGRGNQVSLFIISLLSVWFPSNNNLILEIVVVLCFWKYQTRLIFCCY